MQMERHKNKEGNQIGRAYMRHAGGSMRLSVAEFSMENKVKCFQLRDGRSFSSFQGDLYYRDCFNFFSFTANQSKCSSVVCRYSNSILDAFELDFYRQKVETEY